MNYKDTIRLPGTAFSMRGNLIEKEPMLLLRWEEDDLYGRIRSARQGSPLFILHDGPPYANGNVHLGTALNKILKDFIVKSYTMMGYDSPYVPGWDCHGMPIEHRITLQVTDSEDDLSRMEIRKRCREYAAGFVPIQREEFKRLGVFGDWDHPYLTMSRSYEAGIVRAFGRLVREGYVYKGLRPIHWCTSCSTALAEAEVEYSEHRSPSIYVAFRLSDPAMWQDRGVPERTEVVIWTTTPWTLPANQAVALNPLEKYVVTETPDGRRFLAAAARMDEFLSDTGLSGCILEGVSFTGSELEGLLLEHPVFDSKTSLVILAEHVTMDDGTGCVHTAPGHGAEDFMVAGTYGLEVFSLVLEDGTFSDEAGKYRGLHVFDANASVVDDLRSSGNLIASSEVDHSYPHCWRCKKPLIFRATRQFFLDLSRHSLKERVLERVDEVDWHPSWGYERMKNMMSIRPDWCLSRQRSWGVALPVFTCDDCDEPVMDPDVIEKVAELVAEEGSDIWFGLEPSAVFASAGSECVCPSCGSGNLSRVDDILDVWFDSSLSHYIVLTDEYGLSRPAAVYLEATDQHRGWFGVSMITSEALGLSRPADHIITHGLVQDRSGKKMSKSLGNYISPLEIVDRMGTDILRLWFASIDYTADFRADLTQLDDSREAYRKLRNTIRFMLGNIDPDDSEGFSPEELQGLDRYIYLRFREISRFCIREYRGFEFHRVFRELRNFAVIELSGLYLDTRKDRLYCDALDSKTSLSTRRLFAWMARELTKLLAPVIPFTAEDVWDHLPAKLREGCDSVHLALFTDTPEQPSSEREELDAWKPYLDVRREVMKSLEEARAAGEIGSGLDASVSLTLPRELVESACGENWADFLIVSSVDITPGDELSVSVTHASGDKCQRCWKILPEVGSAGFADDLCNRCSAVVEGIS